MTARNRKLRMEQMEAREMMAVTVASDLKASGNYVVSAPTGDIAAYVQNGNLYVNESVNYLNSDNGVRIAQTADGHVRVMGTIANNSTGHVSSVNGYGSQDFTVTGNLYVSLGGGNDLVQLGFADGSGAPSVNELHIDTSAPQPVLAKAKTTAKAVAGTGSIFDIADNDQVMIWAANTRAAATITTGTGNDWVFVGAATIGDGVGADDLTINTGAGSDEVDIRGAHVRRNLDIQTYSAVTENDVDSVYIDSKFSPTNLVDGTVNIRTGGGNDGVYSTDPNITDANVFWLGIQSHGAMSIDTGTGNDTLYLRNLRVGGNLSVNTGAGADTLDMRQTAIDGEFGFPAAVSGSMTVQMYATASETDVDTASFNKIGTSGVFTVLMGGGNDVLNLTDGFSSKDINIDAGLGDDTVALTRVMANDNFFTNLGEGNDTLTILDLFGGLGKTQILGGNGIDHLTKMGAYPTSQLTETGWEYINGLNQSLVNGAAKASKTSKK